MALFDFDPHDLSWTDDDSFNYAAEASTDPDRMCLLEDDVSSHNQTSLSEINALLKPDTSDPWHLRSDLISASFNAPDPPAWPGSSSVGNQMYSTSLDSGYNSNLVQARAPHKARSVYSNSSSTAYRVDKKGRSRPRAISAPLICHECDPPRTFNNHSEMKKDRLRHTKPFTCEVHGCGKQFEGFPTKNDLERHRKAVHGMEPTLGDKSGYKCVLCASPAYSEKKTWPRKDNFKSHILRKHPGQDVNLVIEQSKVHQSMSSYDSALGSQIDTVNEIPYPDQEMGTIPATFAPDTHDATSVPYHLPLESELAGLGLVLTDILPSPAQCLSSTDDPGQQTSWPAYDWGHHHYAFDI